MQGRAHPVKFSSTPPPPYFENNLICFSGLRDEFRRNPLWTLKLSTKFGLSTGYGHFLKVIGPKCGTPSRIGVKTAFAGRGFSKGNGRSNPSAGDLAGCFFGPLFTIVRFLGK
jgi:hypothetical protein